MRSSTRFRRDLIHDLSPEERVVLEARLRAPTTEQRQESRARIVLLATEGHSTRSIAREFGTMR
jgi:hypothetical protein